MKLNWLDDDARHFLKLKYLRKGETIEQRYQTIFDAAQRYWPDEGFGDRLKGYVENNWLSFATPVLRNFGASDNLSISCQKMVIPDTLDGILSGLHQVGMQTKYGSGTSVNFTNIRPMGSDISTGGTSEGVMPFIELYEALITKTAQNGSRRGAMSAYLSIDHPEILSFLDIGKDGNPIKTILPAVTIPKGWIQSLKDGDVNKRKIWSKLLKMRFEKQKPYILFLDNCNDQRPQWFKDRGIDITTSNLCVSGDQRVPTNYGYLTAEELNAIGKPLKLFDNDSIVESSAMELIDEDAETFKITLDNGMSHTITGDHKLLVSKKLDTPKSVGGKSIWEEHINVQCKDIKIGDRVCVQTRKGVFGPNNRPREAFLLGLYQSDGTQSGNSVSICIWENDFDLEQEINTNFEYICEKYDVSPFYSNKGRCLIESNVGQSDCRKKSLNSVCFKKAMTFEKGFVPDWIWESDEHTHWQYLRGLLYADGSVYVSRSNGNPIQISYVDINKEFLQELQLLYSNLGLQSSIRLLRKGAPTLLPDGKGGSKYYDTKDAYRLIVGNKNDAIQIEKHTGFLSRKNIKVEDREYRDNTKKCYKVKSIDYVGRQPVYCVSVKNDKHLWCCNGIITHNCNEVVGESTPEKTFACCLSSVNLLYYDQWKDTRLVYDCIAFLNCVLDEYIEQTENIPGLDRSRKHAIENRSVGLGTMGLHSYLQSKMIPFTGLRAEFINNSIYENIRRQAEFATKDLVKHWGECLVTKGYGRVNDLVMAIAPTKSTGILMGKHSIGIEPFKSNYHTKESAGGSFSFRNPYLKNVLANHGKDTSDTWNSVLDNLGSVQHLDFLTKNEKEVFKCFHEISQMDIVRLAAIRQKHIDQGQSLNLMFTPTTPIKDINKVILESHNLGVKGLYYQYNINAAQQADISCSSCEG